MPCFMLTFQDFVPQAHRETELRWNLRKVHHVESGSFEEVVAAANAWIEEEEIEVFQLETVVLPNIWAPGEGGSTDGALAIQHTGDQNPRFSHWHQFLRVWYRTPASE